MGLIIIEKRPESCIIEAAYEGTLSAPPYEPETISIGRIVSPDFIAVRTAGIPGNIELQLEPVSSNSRSGRTRYRIRDGEQIRMLGHIDYDAFLQLIPNGATDHAGAVIEPTLAAPISSCRIALSWGDEMPILNPPPDQGALIPAFRAPALGGAGTIITTRPIVVPASGQVSWICDRAAGPAGDITLLQGGVEQTAPLADFGTWEESDLIAGQIVKVRFRNTGAAGAFNLDLRIVR